MKKLFRQALQILQKGEDIVIGTIIKRQGSAPREAGTKIVIKKDGSFIGTIGGGLIEAQVIESAKKIFKSEQSILNSFDMTHEQLETSSMICGGKLEVLIDIIKADSPDVGVLQTIFQAYTQQTDSVYITSVSADGKKGCQTEHCLLERNGNIKGETTFSYELPDAVKAQIVSLKSPSIIEFDERKIWAEPLVFAKKLFIFGAGHVSRPTAALSTMVGFQVIVLDDREELIQSEFFPEPIVARVVEDFNTCLNDLDINQSSYLVIITRGHFYDKSILSQALKIKSGYIGMIGSRKKRDKIYQHLLDEGFTQEDLNRVHCPIGLKMGAETPEEIAISIVAELVQTRADNK